ncbi:MAG: hypothetical protein ACR2ML_01730 [Solirubrobacteraceae bacterium]
MTDVTFSPYLALWAAPDGPLRAAADETGQVLVFTEDFAALFAARLSAHGFRSVAWPTNPGQVVDLLLAAGVSAEEAPERISVFEAQTLGEADAERWCLELADRLVKNAADGQEDENGHGTDITF